MKKITLIICTICCAVLAASAQKIKLQSGDIKTLKGTTEFNVKYIYENITVGKLTEQAYIEKKVSEYNKDQQGRGDSWKKSWIADRPARYEPKFEELMNKRLSAQGIRLSENSNSKYTLVFKTIFIEPGFNVGVWRENASINAIIDIVETANPSNIIATITLDKAPGKVFGGYDYDTGLRIQEAYAKAGKELAEFLIDEGLKK
ncbi:hypothetical protein C3K47_15975 [Solitalea longa]|uniref:DUF4468 domain-containing protein n=1 Tax=Solitalea longa TaxID=2079460 RepID=A0A2S4ZY53_9SPHI|nr:hypothetical protein [Solitalea longa]POY35280.1 hypothetical protein C3K47_15975 [Solitalea longa]